MYVRNMKAESKMVFKKYAVNEIKIIKKLNQVISVGKFHRGNSAMFDSSVHAFIIWKQYLEAGLMFSGVSKFLQRGRFGWGEMCGLWPVKLVFFELLTLKYWIFMSYFYYTHLNNLRLTDRWEHLRRFIIGCFLDLLQKCNTWTRRDLQRTISELMTLCVWNIMNKSKISRVMWSIKTQCSFILFPRFFVRSDGNNDD